MPGRIPTIMVFAEKSHNWFRPIHVHLIYEDRVMRLNVHFLKVDGNKKLGGSGRRQ
jgi:hypothetical protein